jgi:hypothetical protein
MSVLSHHTPAEDSAIIRATSLAMAALVVGLFLNALSGAALRMIG